MVTSGLRRRVVPDRADHALVDEDVAAEVDAWVQQRWDEVLDHIEAARPDVILWPMMYYFMIGYVRRLLGEVRELLSSS